MVLTGNTTRLYGNVQLGKNVILEDDVVIGHPSAAELQGCFDELDHYESLEQLYQSRSVHPTIIGDNSIIRSGTVIYSGVTIGSNFDCSHRVLIRENCTIGNDVYIKADTILMKQVSIGNQCRISGIVADFSVIHDRVCSYGSLTHVHAGTYTPDMSKDIGPVLHTGVLVGRGALVIGTIHIHEDTWIAGNTVVTSDVPAGSLVIGPKGEIRERKERASSHAAILLIEQRASSRSEH